MKKTYILSTIILLAIAIAGCKKGFLSQEVNPNTPIASTPQFTLSGAQGTTASFLNTGFTTFGIWLGYYAPSGNYTISSTTEQYNITTSTFNYFSSLYPNITNYTLLVTQAAANPALSYFGAIGKIMIAMDYQELVDEYNDVPYTQAEKGFSVLFPAYDSGQNVIYPDLLKQLDAAIAMINANPTATNPGTSDIIFGGNMTSWKKFANTLKLRIAIRQSNIAATKGALVTELGTTALEGYLDDKTFAYAQPGYLASDANNGQQSPYWKTYGFNSAGVEASGHATNRANAFFITFLQNHGADTLRAKQFYAPVNTLAESTAALKNKVNPVTPPNDMTHIIGNPFGNDNAYNTNTNTSPIGPGILISPTMPAAVITGPEACFLLSEGVLEGYLTPAQAGSTAKDYYQRGITASFVALGLTAAQANTYYSQAVVDVNWDTSAAAAAPVAGTIAGTSPYGGVNGSAPAGTALLRAIMTQKYIALFGYSVGEVYNEYRRTGLPDITAPSAAPAGSLTARTQTSGAKGKGAVLNRVYFPSSETTTNAAAVAAEPAVDPFVSLIFWARNVN
jgi:hypothetical protein